MRRADLDNLEALLRYFNVTCASAVADMDADKRVLMLASVACVASEALLSCKRTDVTTDVLLNAAAPYYAELCEHLGDGRKPPDASEYWIKFSAVAEYTGGAATTKSTLDYSSRKSSATTRQDRPCRSKKQGRRKRIRLRSA